MQYDMIIFVCVITKKVSMCMQFQLFVSWTIKAMQLNTIRTKWWNYEWKQEMYSLFWGSQYHSLHFERVYWTSESRNKWRCWNIKYRCNSGNKYYFKPLKVFAICSCSALPIAFRHLLIVSLRNFSQQQETVKPVEVNVTFGCSLCIGHFVFSIDDFMLRSIFKGNLLISNEFRFV